MKKRKSNPMVVPLVIIGIAAFLILGIGVAILMRSGKIPGLKSEMVTRIEHDPWWQAGVSSGKIEKLLREMTEHSSCVIVFNQRGDYRIVSNFSDEQDDVKYHQTAPVIFWSMTVARNPTLEQELPDDWRRVVVGAGYGRRLDRRMAEVLLDEAMKEPSKRQTRVIYEKNMDDFMGQLDEMANRPNPPQQKRK